MTPSSRLIILSISLILCISPPVVNAKEREYIKIPGSIHIHSNISTGKDSVDVLAKMAKDKGTKVMILTDHLLLRAEYGILPFRNLFCKRTEENSILKYGAKKYLKLIEQVDEYYPDLIVIPGSEVTPYYYFTGSYFHKNLTMHNFGKQLLVVGLSKPEDFEQLPILSNKFAKRHDIKTIYQLSPLLILILGLWLIKKKKVKKISFKRQTIAVHTHPYRPLGAVLSVLAVLSLVNNFPFSSFEFNQYHKEQGISPYQNLIDYVNKKGGLTFWSAPDITSSRMVEGIKLHTQVYSKDLLESKDYTGFAVFYEGHKTGNVGGIWDQTLIQYCKGERERPVWTIGEVDFHSKERGKRIDSVQTVFLVNPVRKLNPLEKMSLTGLRRAQRVGLSNRVKRMSKERILNALKDGKMYAKLNSKVNDLSLDKFVIENRDKSAWMGDEIICRSSPKIKIEVSSSDINSIKVELIRKGKIVKIFNFKKSKSIIFEDDYFSLGEKIYYRLSIISEYGEIISNPIFVEFRGRSH